MGSFQRRFVYNERREFNMENEKKKQVKIKMKQINPDQIKNPDLVKALEMLKENKTPQTEGAMIAELQKAQLLSPVILSGSKDNVQIKFVLINTKDGRSFFPVFTDNEEAKKLNMPLDGNKPAPHQYMIRMITDYKPMFSDPNNQAVGVVVNPMGANIVIPKQLVLKLAEMKETKNREEKAVKDGAIPAGVSLTFSEPRIYPTALVNAVHDKCEGLKDVKRVWFKQVMVGMALSFALIVETDGSNDSASFETIKEAAVPHAKDVPVMVMKYSEELEKHAVKGSVPLYDSELGL